MRLICYCSKHGFSKTECHDLQNVQFFCVYVQKTAQTSFRIFLQTRILMEGGQIQQSWQWWPIFKSQLLKMAAARKYLCNKVEAASKIKHADTT